MGLLKPPNQSALMGNSLLFIPDISGYTKFVQTTEIEHSLHVISELLEVLISSNIEGLELAEVEGDALFFFKEESVPSADRIMAQINAMFTAFYSHLKMLETNRICPCNACATAPELNLKIIIHSGELQFINVQGSLKPFGNSVIEAHRVLKNSIASDSYVLVTDKLHEITSDFNAATSAFGAFKKGKDVYDDIEIPYSYSELNSDKLSLKEYPKPQIVEVGNAPDMVLASDFNVSGAFLLEQITNYKYRHNWAPGLDRIEFDESEVTRLGSEHTCVIHGDTLNFKTVAKKNSDVKYLTYGELTTSPSPLDRLYQFFVITPKGENSCHLRLEYYWEAKSPIKKLLMVVAGKKAFRKSGEQALDNLKKYVELVTQA